MFSKIFMSTFDYALRLYGDLDDDQEMITPYQLGLLMVDWTDPQKAAEMSVGSLYFDGQEKGSFCFTAQLIKISSS
jgi:hypothetical protein